MVHCNSVCCHMIDLVFKFIEKVRKTQRSLFFFLKKENAKLFSTPVLTFSCIQFEAGRGLLNFKNIEVQFMSIEQEGWIPFISLPV